MNHPNRYPIHIKPLVIDYQARLVRLGELNPIADTGFVQFDGWEDRQISIFGDVSGEETTIQDKDILYSALNGLDGWRLTGEDLAKLAAHLNRVLELSGRHFDCVIFSPHKTPLFQYMLQKIFDAVSFDFHFRPSPEDFTWNSFFDSIRWNDLVPEDRTAFEKLHFEIFEGEDTACYEPTFEMRLIPEDIRKRLLSLMYTNEAHATQINHIKEHMFLEGKNVLYLRGLDWRYRDGAGFGSKYGNDYVAKRVTSLSVGYRYH